MKKILFLFACCFFYSCNFTKAGQEDCTVEASKTVNEIEKDTTIHLQLLLKDKVVCPKDSIVYYSVINNTKDNYATGTDFHIERLENGKWIPLKYKANTWEAISYGIKAKDTLVFHFRLKAFWHKFHTGTYKIIKSINKGRTEKMLELKFKFESKDIQNP